jgi:hypothetical protein
MPIVFPSDWSPDGKYLAYFRTDPKTQLDIWFVALNGEARKPRQFLHGDFNESQGQFSPDGKWMAYVSDESGAAQIYVQSFPTPSGQRQISSDGGTQPRWAPNGRELFYVSRDRRLMAVSVQTGAAFEAEAPRELFATALPAAPLRQAYSVSNDGQRFLMNVPVEARSAPITVVLNWTGLLRK